MNYRDNVADKKVFIFDIDGTIADSYGSVHEENAKAISRILESGRLVAFATDRAKDLIEGKVINLLPKYEEYLEQIFMLPAGAAAMYYWDGDSWNELYAHRLDESVKSKAVFLHKEVLKEVDSEILEQYEPFILDKDSLMLSLSAMPDISDREYRLNWDVDRAKRKRIMEVLQKEFPELHINIGGSTTVNVANKGIDKAYGVNRLLKHLGLGKEDVLYFGDAMHKGGNDRPVKDAGVDVVHVKNPQDTLVYLESVGF